MDPMGIGIIVSHYKDPYLSVRFVSFHDQDLRQSWAILSDEPGGVWE